MDRFTSVFQTLFLLIIKVRGSITPVGSVQIVYTVTQTRQYMIKSLQVTSSLFGHCAREGCQQATAFDLSLISGILQMSASHSAKELQKLIQIILNALLLDHFARQCSDLTTLGRFCDPCMQLKAVNAKLYAHFEEINKLLKIQAEVKKRVNQHHDPLSHLPLEISSHIFAIYTEDVNSDFDPLSVVVERGGPLLLGAVSQLWRQVSFSTPHLWNTVNIHILSNDNLRTKVKLTQEWLARSRQLPKPLPGLPNMEYC
jgi:hypothetical protein